MTTLLFLAGVALAGGNQGSQSDFCHVQAVKYARVACASQERGPSYNSCYGQVYLALYFKCEKMMLEQEEQEETKKENK